MSDSFVEFKNMTGGKISFNVGRIVNVREDALNAEASYVLTSTGIDYRILIPYNEAVEKINLFSGAISRIPRRVDEAY